MTPHEHDDTPIKRNEESCIFILMRFELSYGAMRSDWVFSTVVIARLHIAREPRHPATGLQYEFRPRVPPDEGDLIAAKTTLERDDRLPLEVGSKSNGALAAL